MHLRFGFFACFVILFLISETFSFDFSGLWGTHRNMFYNTNYIEVVNARIRLGLHMPSEHDDFNTWLRKR
ncbi:Neuropeptide-Like Protein [Caenorhabditis elegans]|uniref:Neuropeptide-Like Protein n=1 Tax=Caenorhabditis elegans TaxID=6239 RepID=H2L268_CAEEL|nr:Neuropeptide-Like Protein [Caenorhabditis elegans]CCE71392.1 Neuropeptide-Like Protein [Caenorhabditis elegans]|eukprot:NP_001254217.1 Uncharacterized protein CELE_F35H8.12 [Caenorhabditis elegans]